MKKCSKCKKYKQASEFYRDKRTKDGLYSACKACHYHSANKDAVKKWRIAHPDKVREHNRKAIKEFASRHPNYWNENPKPPGYQAKYHKRAEQWPRYIARQKLNAALKQGKITQDWCAKELERDDCKGRIEGHHEDYSKPLEVIWLCAKHHKEIHKKY